ncbi:coenzyme Q-binding protein COQ10 [Parvibaculum indicum]|uniref:type II toxin-antitoxin system RatA family toxin n=1 Tax=Parvibaculum indicum TaxID=562969 RepID=UPI00141FB223|nr:type II toxin-antitoxin system RatA family toxin [Parvibaculum indicum]NIJ42761.1 coenzyme Q-binding protein COQ10 [Parvibaculum indicum]
MPAHEQSRDVPYSARDMYALVADIASYPDFLPWCNAARIRKREPAGAEMPGGEIVVADLIVSYKLLREQFTSRVLLDPRNLAIDVGYIKGPFKHLMNRWRFEELEGGASRVHFEIDFEFKSRMLERLIGEFFDRALTKMMGAFLQRADELYGNTAES